MFVLFPEMETHSSVAVSVGPQVSIARIRACTLSSVVLTMELAAFADTAARVPAAANPTTRLAIGILRRPTPVADRTAQLAL